MIIYDNLDGESSDKQPEITDGWDMSTRIARAFVSMKFGGEERDLFLSRRKLGKELQARRYQLNMSCEQVAAEAQIPFEMMSHIEGGFVTEEELSTLIEPLLKALQLNPEDYKDRISGKNNHVNER